MKSWERNGKCIWFCLPDYGRMWEGLKKRSTALPFLPVGGRWLGRKRYETWGIQECTPEGYESLGRQVTFQPVGRSTCWGSSVCGFVSLVPAPPPRGVIWSIYIQSKMYRHIWGWRGKLGDSGERPCPCCSSYPLPLSFWPPFVQHHAQGTVREVRLLWEHTPVCYCVGECSPWASLSSQSWLISVNFVPGASWWMSAHASAFLDRYPK